MSNDTKHESPEDLNARVQKEIQEGARPGHDDMPSAEDIERMTATAPEHIERAGRYRTARAARMLVLFPHLAPPPPVVTEETVAIAEQLDPELVAEVVAPSHVESEEPHG